MVKASPREELLRLLAPVAAASGLDLEDLAVTPAGKRRVVRVVVDKDGGVSLDDVAAVSQAVSATLDEPPASAALGGTPYVLEVTSPGVDRPLTEVRHWRRAAGRLVTAPLAAGGDVTGRVVSASDDAIVLDVDGSETSYAPGDLGTGRIQVEFSRRPGSPDEDAPDEDALDDDTEADTDDDTEEE